MKNDEIRCEIEKLKNEQFMLQMKDRWSDKDYDKDMELHRKIMKLEEKLK